MSGELVPPAERVKLLKKFETGELREVSIRASKNMNGKTASLFFRPAGALQRVVCGPAYKYSLAECKPSFPFDLARLPELSKP